MKADDPNLKAHYRMPRVFGNLPGPRNVPIDKRDLPNNQTGLQISVTALTDRALLQELCPPDCEVDGEGLVNVSQRFHSNIGWLAGRGYSVVGVTFPIIHRSKTSGSRQGSFAPVLWESLADPIITGREELGFAKLYADMPPARIVADTYSGLASWEGFKFFEIEATDLTEVTASSAPSYGGTFHYKFIPKTGSLGESDVEYLEYAPPGGIMAGYGDFPVTRHMTGSGRFTFFRARWEDVPLQYPIINALAELPLHEIRSATVTSTAERGPIGNPSSGELREVEDSRP